MKVLRHFALAMGAAVLASATGAATPAAAAIAVSGSLNIAATTILSPTSPYDATVAVVDNSNPTWTSTPQTLNASVTSTSVSAGDTVSAFGTATATWASATAGSVTLSNFGWQFNAATDFSSASFTNPDGGPNGIGPLNNWNYTFVATGNGQFLMNYNVTAAGNQLIGLWGWGIGSTCIGIDCGSGGPDFNPFDPTATGTFIADLVAGQTYTFGLVNRADIYEGTPGIPPNTLQPAVFNGSMSGQFDWSITESGVPEPAAWAMMLSGFGLAGAALRRRPIGAT